MTWPNLVQDWMCQTPITLVVEDEGLTEDGAPAEVFSAELLCNWQDGGKVELTPEQKYVRITGKALFPGDICPEVPVIAAGYGIVDGARRTIAYGSKARNADGSVNFTEVRFR